ncbi:MAG: cytochrome c oxidase subunit II [Candidatus Zixiibacteriota bacterium]|nr:MAG: cytochrome c oxidase subunit II [candidate division Zixibacteria bacterium]
MDTTGNLILPPSGSTYAPQVDALLTFLTYMSLFFIVVIFGAIIYFVIRYRRRGAEPEYHRAPAHNTALEIVWTIIPLILVLFLFVWGFRVYMRMNVVPKDALEIQVTAQKWFWSFTYPDGATSVNELVVPVGRPIKLLLSSRDVIHSFYVPDFRIKRDTLPNRYGITWFEATQVGEHDLFCAEYCGSKHSAMIGKVRVVSDREYREWLETSATAGEGLPPEEFGERLYTSRGCINCHSLDGTPGNGPSMLGVFGSRVQLTDGTSVIADENYVRESILEPQAKIVAGYQPIMPTYQTILRDEEVNALIAYLKTLSEQTTTGE